MDYDKPKSILTHNAIMEVARKYADEADAGSDRLMKFEALKDVALNVGDPITIKELDSFYKQRYKPHWQ